jgi:outer membrane biogenesis lipoprotein LolB
MAKLNNDFFNLKGWFILALVFFLTACAATDARNKKSKKKDKNNRPHQIKTLNKNTV